MDLEIRTEQIESRGGVTFNALLSERAGRVAIPAFPKVPQNVSERNIRDHRVPSFDI